MRKNTEAFGISLNSIYNQIESAGNVVGLFFKYWSANSRKILMLTFVNVVITCFTEVVSRTVLVNTITQGSQYGFFVGDGAWYNIINQQSLINITMTFFVSLFGGVIFFIKHRSNRFLFFILFGGWNSFMSQYILMNISAGAIAISGTRLLFDFFYNMTLKFFMFEFYRKPIVQTNTRNVGKLFFLRGKQDLVTSFLKNFALNILRLKG